MKIDTGIQEFTFKDMNDHVFASFHVNPADPGIAQRCQEVAEYFTARKDDKPSTLGEIVEFGKQLTEKISYILGYDAAQDIFGEISAITILPSGELYALVVLDTIADAVTPEIKKRKAAMSKAADKYLKKYQQRHGGKK